MAPHRNVTDSESDFEDQDQQPILARAVDMDSDYMSSESEDELQDENAQLPAIDAPQEIVGLGVPGPNQDQDIAEENFVVQMQIFIIEHLNAQQVRELIHNEQDLYRWMLFLEQLERATRTLRLALTLAGRGMF
jgi:hypothetical protein